MRKVALRGAVGTGCVAIVALIIAGLMLTGCSSTKTASRNPFAGIGSPMYKKPGPIPKGGGRYVVGDPYQVAGQWYTPKEDPNYDKVGTASWYGPQFHRRMTSNGEWFDMDYLSAAHATLPLPCYVKVTNLENGRSLIVRVNDRGPFVGTRVIDLSRRSADVLGYRGKGTALTRVRYLGPAPLNDKGTDLAAMNRALARGLSDKQLIALANGKQPGVPETMVATARAPQQQQPPAVFTATEPEQPSNAVAAATLPTLRAQSISVQASAGALPFQTAAETFTASGYFVQVGAFADLGNARRTKEELLGIGPVEVMPIPGGAGTLYRVRLGPLRSETAAESALEQVQAAGHADARLVLAQN